MKFQNLFFNSIICIFLFSCGGLSKNNLQDLFTENEKELTQIANQFLIQDKIQNLSISTDDKSICQMINKWRNCPKISQNWEDWSDSLKMNIVLNSSDEVLLHENIEPENYQYYQLFLKKYFLYEIAKDLSICEDCISIESGLNGLRYYKNEPNDMKTDHEYLSVKRLNSNWFIYTRDWN